MTVSFSSGSGRVDPEIAAEGVEPEQIPVAGRGGVLHGDDHLRRELAGDLGGASRIEMPAAGGDQEDVDVGHRLGLLFRERVTQVAQMADDHAVQLDQVRRVVPALRAVRLILMGADAGDEDVVDLVLAGPSMVSNSGFTAARLACSGCGDETVTISAVCLARVKPVFLPTGSVMTTASLPRMRKQLCPYQRNSAIGSQSFQCPAQGMRDIASSRGGNAKQTTPRRRIPATRRDD